MLPKDQSVPVAYVRGGTSKALFFHERHVLQRGAARHRFLWRLMGSPDRMQIDGMGGSNLVISKAAIIAPSSRDDADVDCTFVQLGIGNATVGYTGNFGNISAGVGPFAVDEGLLKQDRPGGSVDPKVTTKEVRIYNTGTRKLLISHVPIDPTTGLALEAGEYAIAGCPGAGAPILMDYRNVIGAALGRGALPTGNAQDSVQMDGKSVPITICDVANIIVFAFAKDLSIAGSETLAALDRDASLVARQKELLGKAAQKVGMCQDWTNVDAESPMLPMVVLLSSSTTADAQIQARLFLDNRCHTSMADTGAICTAACSRIPGSIAHELTTADGIAQHTFNIQHPLGIMRVVVETETNYGDENEGSILQDPFLHSDFSPSHGW